MSFATHRRFYCYDYCFMIEEIAQFWCTLHLIILYIHYLI